MAIRRRSRPSASFRYGSLNKTVDEELVYQITNALWNENSRKLLDEGHQEGERIQLSAALKGISIPLQLGAKRFCKEVGLVDD